MKKFISSIKSQSEKLRQLTNEELDSIIEKIKKRSETTALDNIIVDWFAMVQEISFRKIGLRHFDTQLSGGLLLHQAKIVEMKTGEGKTLTSTLPIALNALTKKGVHVVTVNEYLAERDKNWMGKIYEGLGLTVGLVKSTSTNFQKRKNYNSDITYVTNSEVVFDYLRDSSASNVNDLVQRSFSYCLIDEIDSILIDEARTPLILSEYSGEQINVNKLYIAKTIARFLEKEIDFQVDEKRREINLTEIGYKKASKKLGKESLYDPADPWILDILNALKAEYIFKLNKDYIVLNNKIVIVDEFTGRIMEDRRWSMGIHEAIEMKERVKSKGVTKTKSSITYQNFFTLYPKLAGMTGTGKTTEKEFKDIYNLEVRVLPTAKPMIRKDLPDLVYQTELGKWKAVVNKSKECFTKGQPILIGTSSVEKSEFLSDLFQTIGIPHQVLNAKPENVIRESEIIAQAGEQYAVTIATNMAGRGTDIILGGNSIFQVKQKILDVIFEKNENESDSEIQILLQKLFEEYETKHTVKKLENDIQNLPYSLENAESSLRDIYNYFYKQIDKIWKKNNKKVKDLGGLFVLGTERHETRRIDNQLCGRSGRQGDPGNSQFFVSLEDDLIKVFGGDSIRRWLDYLMEDKDIPLESKFLTKSLENAQKKIELYNYDLRKNVFQYDEILNQQRKQIFKARKEILAENIYFDFFLRLAESVCDNETLKKRNKQNKEILLSKIENLFNNYSTYGIRKRKNEIKKETKKNKKNRKFYEEIWISNDLHYAESNIYQHGFLTNTKSKIILGAIDFYWTEHLEKMDYIRETINWRSYGQQNPLVEYNLEAMKSFKLMVEKMRSCMLYYFICTPINEYEK